MIPIRTTALIAAMSLAAMSLVGAATPSAFALNNVNIGNINQGQVGGAGAGSVFGAANANVDQEQGFCINIAQADAAVGAVAGAGVVQNAGNDLDCS